jgi:hypothetical protein
MCLIVRTLLLNTLFYAATALGLVLHAQDHGIARGLFQVAAADGAFILLNLCFGSFCVHSYIVRSLELQGLARVRASLTNFIHAHPPEQGLHEPCDPPSGGGGGGGGGASLSTAANSRPLDPDGVATPHSLPSVGRTSKR